MTSRTNPGSRPLGSALRCLTVTAPLPPRELSSNGRHGNWREHAAAVASYRDICGWYTLQAMATTFGLPMEQASISITYQYAQSGSGMLSALTDGYAPIDVGNAIAAAKSFVDAIVRAGALVDDDARHLEYGRCHIRGLEHRSKRGARGEVVVVLNETRFTW